MNDLDFSRDLRELADEADPARLDLQYVAAAAASRRRNRRIARGAAATTAVIAVALAATTLAVPADDTLGRDRVAGAPTTAPTVGAELATPALVRAAIERANEVPARDAATGTLLAQSEDGRLRILGVRGGGRQCVAVYEDDGAAGTLGLTCGAPRTVTNLELAITSGGTGGSTGRDRLSGVLPPGAAAVVLTRDSTTTRVPVIDIPAPWNLAAFVTPWPAGEQTEAAAVDSSGQVLQTAKGAADIGRAAVRPTGEFRMQALARSMTLRADAVSGCLWLEREDGTPAAQLLLQGDSYRVDFSASPVSVLDGNAVVARVGDVVDVGGGFTQRVDPVKGCPVAAGTFLGYFDK